MRISYYTPIEISVVWYPSTMARLRDLWLWALIALLTAFCTCLIALSRALFWPFDHRRTIPHGLASWWGRAVFWCHPPWRVTVTGAGQLRPGERYILVANHQSLLDIMALYHLNRQFKWVAKEELFRVPFLGWAMALAGYVQLARTQPHSIHDAYERVRRWLTRGIPVLFFPEGTRSLTGELGAFKKGAFKLAVETGIPVVPVAVSGTRDLLVKGSWRFRPGPQRVQVTVLPPIAPTTSAESLRDEARSRILKALERLA